MRTIILVVTFFVAVKAPDETVVAVLPRVLIMWWVLSSRLDRNLVWVRVGFSRVGCFVAVDVGCYESTVLVQ